ncbi:MAG: hypothetical protein B6242_14780 [Anaerolineaceae bacterium 4572_78]|nr:MAG: hypothetical protein B6242_14780 [Anaerolineaceae bacterium 4572_78]
MYGVIDIDFQVFFYMVAGAFGLVGFFRGWWKEAITTGLLIFLLLLLERPEIAVFITDQINAVINFFTALVTAQSVNPYEIAGAAGSTPPVVVIDPTTKQMYIIVLIAMIAGSYFFTKMSVPAENVSFGGQLTGAILGMVNGIIAMSLFREYIAGRFLPGSTIAAASAPQEVTIVISSVPRASLADSSMAWFVIAAGALVFFTAIWSRYEWKDRQIKKRNPMGYKGPKPKPGVWDQFKKALENAAK